MNFSVRIMGFPQIQWFVKSHEYVIKEKNTFIVANDN